MKRWRQYQAPVITEIELLEERAHGTTIPSEPNPPQPGGGGGTGNQEPTGTREDEPYDWL